MIERDNTGTKSESPSRRLPWLLPAMVAAAIGLSSTCLMARADTSLRTAMVYPSFPFQGEYVGMVTARSGAEPMKAGLQVAARGESAFRVKLYRGGLPGDPSVQIGDDDVFRLEGGYKDFVLEFAGEGPLRFRYSLNGFTALDERDNERGRLKRVWRESPTLGMNPPAEAIVLFDGSNLNHWTSNTRMTNEGLLKQGATTAAAYGDIRLHVEAKLAFMPESSDQRRSNSGIYIQNRYEVQILDTFAMPPRVWGNGSLYNVAAPLVNASYPPLTWQTYDVYFRAPQFDENGRKTENARVTAYLNGVLVQDDVELESGTGVGGRRQEVARAELYLQDHGGDPVRFRNVWLVEGDYSPPGKPFLGR